MNKKIKIQETKSLIRELDISEQALKQSLAVITSRKNQLTSELLEMGVRSSAPRGKYSETLTDKQKLEIIGGLTK